MPSSVTSWIVTRGTARQVGDVAMNARPLTPDRVDALIGAEDPLREAPGKNVPRQFQIEKKVRLEDPCPDGAEISREFLQAGGAQVTVNCPIMPRSSCSRMWQWYI